MKGEGVMDMKQVFIVILLSFLFSVAVIGQDVPKEWVDPETGHRVVRLSDEPGSSSFYFHQNGYTAKGDKLVFSTPNRAVDI